MESQVYPQWQAMDWLSNHPNITQYPEWKKKQLVALATLYYSLEGPTWFPPIKQRWMDYGKDECGWHSSGFGFFAVGDDTYVELPPDMQIPPCNDLGQFTSLFLVSIEIAGPAPSIPHEVAQLTSLEGLSCLGCNIHGSISDVLPFEALASLSKLSALTLAANHLTGSIPSELGLLTSLSYLSLRENDIRGRIPTEIGSWSLIRTLNLSLNKFRGTIPTSVGRLTQLSEIFLGSNELSGNLPVEIGHATNLFRISLGGNKLRGGLPSQIGQLTELRYIYLESNSISSVPSEIGLLSNLLVVAMFENALAGPLPTEIGRLSLLRSLLLASNTLTSTIPSELGLLGSQLGE